jgi:hypothetical protein
MKKMKKSKIAVAIALLAFWAFLAALPLFCPPASAGEKPGRPASGRETVPLDGKGGYAEIVYGDGQSRRTPTYRERDTSGGKEAEAPAEKEAPDVLENGPENAPEEEAPWWMSRGAKIACACLAAIASAAALWYFFGAAGRKRAQKQKAESFAETPASCPPEAGPTIRAAPVQAAPVQAAPAAKAGLKLTAVSPVDAKQYAVTLADKIDIGRGEGCQVRVTGDDSVSSRHCEITWNAGALYLRDLGSSNGTGVNGVPIRGPHKLEVNDVIELGRVKLRLGEIKLL